MTSKATENLFSYGTLQTKAVQIETFGRLLEGSKEILPGFKRTMIKIEDPDVVELSGEAEHPIITFTGKPEDCVEGTMFKITHHELMDADSYEVSAYKRVKVPLKSGALTWAYIDARCDYSDEIAEEYKRA